MNYKPIIIVAGEPNSIFSEIFFKSLKYKKYKSPIIIIASQCKMRKTKSNELEFDALMDNFIKMWQLKKIYVEN